MKLHILTAGYGTSNGRSFLFPLRHFQNDIIDRGIEVELFRSIKPSLYECDVMGVESKFYLELFKRQPARVPEELDRHRSKVPRLVWFDTTDSTGTLQNVVLPIVDRYFKSQLVRDREAYRTAWYGSRIFSHYYHTNFGIDDNSEYRSVPVTERSHLEKLAVSWNSCFRNFLPGRIERVVDDLFLKIFKRQRVYKPSTWAEPGVRQIRITARFGTSYHRETIAYQRKMIARQIRSVIDTDRLPYRRYLDEMKNSNISISPFGWGEIAYRDFESIAAGCLLMKPDMGHQETWPDLYVADETYVPFSWDGEDLLEKLNATTTNIGNYLDVARSAQRLYQRHICDDGAGDLFAARLQSMLAY